MMGDQPYRRLQDVGFGALAALLVASGLAVPLTSLPNPDIAWLSFVAGRYLEGARLYVDLIEINPPGIVFFNLPAAALARVSALSGPVAYTWYVALLATLAVAATCRLLRPLFRAQAEARVFCLLLLLALFPLAGRHFGQREHVMLALVLPWIGTALRRLEGLAPNPRQELGVGLLAGVGLALKPHFLLIGAALELLITQRKGCMLLRLENRIAAGVIGLYMVATVVATPEYFALLGELGGAYAGYLNQSLVTQVTQPFILLVTAGLLAWLGIPVREPWRSTNRVLVYVVLASLLMAAVQGKGWPYHYYPAYALTAVVLGVLALRGRSRSEEASRIPGRLAAGLVLISLLAYEARSVLATLEERARREARTEHVANRIRRLCDSPRIAVFSPDAESSFPLATSADFRWSLSISSLWPLSTAYEDQVREGAPLRWHELASATRAERFLTSSVVEDLLSTPPDLVLVDRAASVRAFGDGGFGYLDYFRRLPALRHFFERYEFAGEWAGYRVWSNRTGRACWDST